MANEIKPTRRGFLAGALALLGLAPAAARAAAAPTPSPELDPAAAVDAFGHAGERLLPLLNPHVSESWIPSRDGCYYIRGHVYPTAGSGVFVQLLYNGIPDYTWKTGTPPRYGDQDSVGTLPIEFKITVYAGDRIELTTSPPSYTSFQISRVDG